MNFFSELSNNIQLWLSSLVQQAPNLLTALLKIIIIFIAVKILIPLCRRILKVILFRKQFREDEIRNKKRGTIYTVLGSAIKYILYFVAIIASLDAVGLGAAANSLLATAGIGALAISLGAQAAIKDIVSGFLILFENEYSVGDYVKIGDVSGTVESLSIRSTTVRVWTGELTLIPNGNIVNVTNYSRSNMLAVVDIDVSYESDIQHVKEAMLRGAKRYAEQHQDVVVEEPVVMGIT
ncbi:MAG: mechanosensitive ion channel family protein, partial [Christensenellales bacterium]